MAEEVKMDYIIDVTPEQHEQIIKNIEAEKVATVSSAEWSRFVLRALISYHERTTMGIHPELDCWKRGLEFAVSCVEEKIPK